MILEVCRACLTSENPLFNLFESESEHGITLAEMFACISGTSVEPDDQWPQYICGTCLLALIDAYELQVLVGHSMSPMHFT